MLLRAHLYLFHLTVVALGALLLLTSCLNAKIVAVSCSLKLSFEEFGGRAPDRLLVYFILLWFEQAWLVILRGDLFSLCELGIVKFLLLLLFRNDWKVRVLIQNLARCVFDSHLVIIFLAVRNCSCGAGKICCSLSLSVKWLLNQGPCIDLLLHHSTHCRINWAWTYVHWPFCSIICSPCNVTYYII